MPARPSSVAAVDTGNSRNDGSLVLTILVTPTTAVRPIGTGTSLPAVATAIATVPPVGGLSLSPTPTPRAEPAPIGAADVVRRVASAEAALRTGSFLITMDYGSGVSSSMTILFARGDAGHPTRLHTWTIYRAVTDTRMTERITLGDRAWERARNGAWAACRAQVGTATTNCSLASTIEDTPWMSWPISPLRPGVVQGGITREGDTLRWYDAEHDADMTLRVDPETGIPRTLRVAMRISNWTIDVDYLGWNSPVAIEPPVEGGLP